MTRRHKMKGSRRAFIPQEQKARKPDAYSLVAPEERQQHKREEATEEERQYKREETAETATCV